MASSTAGARFETLADILEQMGGIDPARIRATPPPGQATENDLIRLNEHKTRLYELVDGVLVEKIMGVLEGRVAARIIHCLEEYLESNNIGMVVTPDTGARLLQGRIRLPDVSYISWKRLGTNGAVPVAPVLDLAPDLAVEVLSPSNTPREMDEKLHEYFESGALRVWYFDPVQRHVRDFHSPDDVVELTEEQTLEGEELLPGFQLPLARVFVRTVQAEAPTKPPPEVAPKPRRRKKG